MYPGLQSALPLAFVIERTIEETRRHQRGCFAEVSDTAVHDHPIDPAAVRGRAESAVRTTLATRRAEARANHRPRSLIDSRVPRGDG